MTWLKLAIRELRNQWRLSLFFVFNLALGLFGLVTLDAYKSALDQSLNSRSRLLLTADLSVSARRELTSAEEKIIDRVLPAQRAEGRLIELLSMVKGPKSSRLVSLTAVDASYPFYGELKLSSGRTVVSASPKLDLLQQAVVWGAPSAFLQLGVENGSILKIGNLELKLTEQVDVDSSSAFNGFSLAPTLYLGVNSLHATGLLGQKGNSVTQRRLYRLPPEADLESLRSTLDRLLTDPAVQVQSHLSAGQQTGRALGYLADYLGLVSLVGLFLAGIGAAYLFRTFLARRLTQIAILLSLGVTPVRAQRLYLLQLIILGVTASSAALLMASLGLPLVMKWTAHLFPYRLDPVLGVRSIQLAFWAGVPGSVLICLPLLRRIRQLRPNLLFQEAGGVDEPEGSRGWGFILWLLPAAVAFWGLAVWQAKSWIIGSVFTASFLASTLIFIGIGRGLLILLKRINVLQDLGIRLAIRHLTRNQSSTLACFLALGLGSLLMTVIPQIRSGLLSEISQPENSSLPSLFLFDIQPEQTEGLKQLLTSRGLLLDDLSPVIRARLLAVNGTPFEKRADPTRLSTREEEQESRSRNRGFNLTYRDQLGTAEEIYQGRPFSGIFSANRDHEAEVSLERRFAERLGLKIGDQLNFDIQGVEVLGRVTSLRKIRWSSFRPNFFVVFQPGVIDEAPKSFIAAVPALPSDKKNLLQEDIVEKFPNISVVDVASTARKVFDLFNQMAWALQWMAALSLFAGLVVIYSISSLQIRGRLKEMSLLKVLGWRVLEIERSILIQFGVTALIASTLGVIMSLGVSYGLAVIALDGVWVCSGLVPIFMIGSVTGLTLLTVWISTLRALRQKPLMLLQNSES